MKGQKVDKETDSARPFEGKGGFHLLQMKTPIVIHVFGLIWVTNILGYLNSSKKLILIQGCLGYLWIWQTSQLFYICVISRNKMARLGKG